MKQHPVPQNIASYEFKLVGDMTLKQFFQLAGGAIIALIIYATPIPGFIKWPLVFIFGALGAALAFLPVEERPLSTWMFAFLKAVYTPTRYVYVDSSVEDVFAKTKTLDNSPAPLSTHKPSGFVENFEVAEKSFVQRISSLFQTTTPPTSQPAPQIPNLGGGRIVEMQTAPTQTPPPQPQPAQPRPGFNVVEEVDVPKMQAVRVEPQQAPVPVQPVQPQAANMPVTPVFRPLPQNPIKSATFSNQAAPPSPPTVPNTVVGQVLSVDGRIVDGAILEIKDMTGKPVRAIRSNKVGHFITMTPLSDGDYSIETEKETYFFDPVRFRAEGQIIPPIQIKAKMPTQ